MTYNPTVYVSGPAAVTAVLLNKGEVGIADVSEKIDSLSSVLFKDFPIMVTSPEWAPNILNTRGAIGDGVSRPLSGFFASLGAAQVVYSFVTSLSQELDWACIQKAMNSLTAGKRTVWVPSGTSFYRINSELTVPDTPGFSIVGENMQTAEIRQMANNTPIFHASAQFKYRYLFSDLRLTYSTQQTFASHPNSAAVLIDGTAYPTSFYYSTIRRLSIDQATYGIRTVQGAPGDVVFWNNAVEDIQCNRISHSLLHLTSPSGAAPVNQISRISMITTAVTQTGPAIYLECDAAMDAIDVEDWTGRIIQTYNSFVTVTGLHIERWVAVTGTKGIEASFGTLTINDYWVSVTIESGTAYMFSTISSATRLNAGRGFVSKNGAGAFIGIISDGGGLIEADEIRDLALTMASQFANDSATRNGVRIRGGLNGYTVSIASAAAITIPNESGSVFYVTGTTAITSVAASWGTRRVTLIFSSAVTFLGVAQAAGSAATIVCDGTGWFRS